MWKSISTVLFTILAIPVYSQQLTVTCPTGGNCYTTTTKTPTQETKPTVDKITKEERDQLDNVDLIVTDYQMKLKTAENALEDAMEYKQLITENIIKSHGIEDPANMTINGTFILYDPYRGLGGGYFTSPSWGVSPNIIGPAVMPNGVITN